MKVLLKTICEKAFITEGTKNLNIIGIFENINVKGFPIRYPQINFVFTIEDSSEKQVEFGFEIISVLGNKILDATNSPQLLQIGKNGKANLIVNLENLELKEEGLHSANFYFGKDKIKESLFFLVKKVQ